MKSVLASLVLLAFAAPALADDCITSQSANFHLCSTDWYGGNIYQYRALPDTRFETHHIAADGFIGAASAPAQSLVDAGSCLASPNRTHYLCAESNGAIYQYALAPSGSYAKHHLAWNGHLGAFLEPNKDKVKTGECIASPNGAVYFCAEDNQNPYAYLRSPTGVYNKYHVAVDGFVGIRNYAGG